jgi:LPXTG-motif cell wall-anchored protein
MSDMSSPAPRPPAPAHEQHDLLLVAQVVAGDRLEADRVQQAQEWLRFCPACAALAEDLRYVSAAVAREPVPARRRDFRLTPEQADRLQGNALSRFLRRLSAPRARALGPAAAGVLSLGLVFVVAGYAVPDDGAVSLVPDANVAPAASVEIAAESTLAPALELAPEADSGTPRAPAAEEAAPADELEAFAADAEFLEGLDEHQAGTSSSSKATGAAPDAELGDDLTAPAQVEREAFEPDAAAPETEGADGASEQRAMAAPAGSPEPAGAGAELTVSTGDDDTAQWLTVIGLALVLGGGGVLGLVWLSRRQRDPLVR